MCSKENKKRLRDVGTIEQKKSKNFKKKPKTEKLNIKIEVKKEEEEEEGHNSEEKEEKFNSNKGDGPNSEIEKPNNKEETYNEDPFFSHFNGNLPKDKVFLLEDQENWKPMFMNWPHLGRLFFKIPKIDQTVVKKEKKLLYDDDDIFLPKMGTFPVVPSSRYYYAVTDAFIHENLIKNFNPKSLSGEQREIFNILSNYLDFVHSEATYEKWNEVRSVCAFHCLNHLFKAHDQILKHDVIVQKYEEKKLNVPRLEDQGFTKPRILILQPFRNSAYKLIKEMIYLLNVEVINKKDFDSYYGPSKRNKDVNKNKPEDFQKIFAGDIDDDFIIGVTLDKKALKLDMSLEIRNLLKCDIIIASPLCLRRMLDADNNIRPSKEPIGQEDFSRSLKTINMLSSIEIFIVDQADVMFMQNWEHVIFIEKALHTLPDVLQGLNIEFNRMHRWYFDSHPGFFRQNIVFSSTTSYFIRGIVTKSKNVAGKVELRNQSDGMLPDIKLLANFNLLRVKKSYPNMSDSDATFHYFTEDFLPQLISDEDSHVLIYFPNHSDYIRLTHFFHKVGGISFATIDEYMIGDDSKIAKARSLFLEGKRKFLLYTERFHFYRRYKIKGVRKIVFYSLPLYSHFLKEVCEFLSEEYQNPKGKFSLSNIYLLYHLSDLKLWEVIGTRNATAVRKSEEYSHSFHTGH